jgi:hypothetical protein
MMDGLWLAFSSRLPERNLITKFLVFQSGTGTETETETGDEPTYHA